MSDRPHSTPIARIREALEEAGKSEDGWCPFCGGADGNHDELPCDIADALLDLTNLEEQLQTSEQQGDLLRRENDRLIRDRDETHAENERLNQQFDALRAAVQKELDYMDGFPGVEDGSPLALVIESLRLALSNPASSPRIDSGPDTSGGVPEGNDGVRGLGKTDPQFEYDKRMAGVPDE